MKRTHIATAASLLVAMMLSGCSEGGNTVESTTEVAIETTVTTTTPGTTVPFRTTSYVAPETTTVTTRSPILTLSMPEDSNTDVASEIRPAASTTAARTTTTEDLILVAEPVEEETTTTNSGLQTWNTTAASNADTTRPANTVRTTIEVTEAVTSEFTGTEEPVIEPQIPPILVYGPAPSTEVIMPVQDVDTEIISNAAKRSTKVGMVIDGRSYASDVLYPDLAVDAASGLTQVGIDALLIKSWNTVPEISYTNMNYGLYVDEDNAFWYLFGDTALLLVNPYSSIYMDSNEVLYYMLPNSAGFVRLDTDMLLYVSKILSDPGNMIDLYGPAPTDILFEG